MPRIEEAGGLNGFAGVYAHCPDLFQGFMYRYGLLWSHSQLDRFSRTWSGSNQLT